MTDQDREEVKNLADILNRQTDTLNGLVQKLKAVKNSEPDVPATIALLQELRDEMDYNRFVLMELGSASERIANAGRNP